MYVCVYVCLRVCVCMCVEREQFRQTDRKTKMVIERERGGELSCKRHKVSLKYICVCVCVCVLMFTCTFITKHNISKAKHHSEYIVVVAVLQIHSNVIQSEPFSEFHELDGLVVNTCS